MNKQEKTLLILFTLFFATLYFSSINFINLVITGCLFIYCMSLSTMKEKIQLLKAQKYVQAAIIFFFFLILSTLFSEDLDKGLHYLKLRTPLLIFPISIGLISLRAAFKEKVLLAYALITVMVCAACFIYGIYNYYNGQTDALYNDNFTSLIEQQSVYIALMVNFAIFILGYFIIYKKSSHPSLLLICALFLILVAYLLGSRINLGVLALVTITFGFYYLIRKQKVLEIITLCLGLVVASIMLYKLQPQMLGRFNELAYSKYQFNHMGVESHYGMELTEDQWNGANLRLAAWQCGWELFTENPLIGVGLGDKKVELFRKYEQKNFKFAIETNKNVHNNYLDVLYGLGIIGFIIFITAWVALPFIYAANQGDWLAVALLSSLACAWVTEIYFDRSLGGMLTGFFVPLILTAKKEKK